MRIATISSRKLSDTYEGNVKNNYLYNDKELFDDGDLNWYDYGFRNYDPQIGRFTELDPLTWEFSFLTPYQYASDDPIANVDIDGLEGGASNIVKGAATVGSDFTILGSTVGEATNWVPTITRAGSNIGKGTKIFSNAQKLFLAIKVANVLNTPITTIAKKNILTTTITSCHGASLPGWSLNAPQGSGSWGSWFKEGWLDGDDYGSQPGGIALRGEGTEYSNGPGIHADYFEVIERADKLIDMIGNGAGPERGTFLKMFDKNFLLSERTSSYFEFIKELTENIKLIRGYMEKYSNNETSGGKRDKLSDKDNSLDPVFLKKGNTVYNRRLGRTFLMTDGKGGGTSTNLPAKDTFPAKKIPPDYIYPRN